MANVIAVGTVNPVELRLHKVLAQLPEDSSLESIYKACLDHDVDTVYFNRRTLFVAGLNSNAEPWYSQVFPALWPVSDISGFSFLIEKKKIQTPRTSVRWR